MGEGRGERGEGGEGRGERGGERGEGRGGGWGREVNLVDSQNGSSGHGSKTNSG